MSRKHHPQPKSLTEKLFTTSTQRQTAPVQTNATIYRAGQNPNKSKHKSTEQDDDHIPMSYEIPDTLRPDQQPTFVDVLKHRRDATGRILTKQQLLSRKARTKRRRPTNTKQSQHIQSPTISHPPTTTQSSSTPAESTNSQSPNETDSDSDDSDFDMSALHVPKLAANANTNTTQQQSSTINESDDIRAKLKRRLALQQQEEAESGPTIVQPSSNAPHHLDSIDSDLESNDSDYESDSSSSSSSSSSSRNARKRKITFLNAKQRETYFDTVAKPSLEEEAELIDATEAQRELDLRQQTQQEVLDYIREQDKKEHVQDVSDQELPDDDDEVLDVESVRKEFEAWKLREMARIVRDNRERQVRKEDKRELERRRGLSDAQIVRENERLGLVKEKKKGKMKFLQKYYHQGVFYRDGSIVGDKVLDRNFNAPTGQDKYINFEHVPKAMKSKNFGKRSQSKWTHLANEDTTFDKEEKEWMKKRREQMERNRAYDK